jgi:single-strand DNA-binding protein
MFRGNLVKDPELRQVGKGQVAKFSIAANNFNVKKGEKHSVYYVECEIWGKQAETLASHAKKGQELWVQGAAQLDEWESKTGDKKSKTIYKIIEFAFVGKKKEEDKQGSEPQNTQEADNFEPPQADENIPF